MGKIFNVNGDVVGFMASGGFSITPADSDLAEMPTAGLYVGTAGDLAVKFVNDDEVVLSNVAAGYHPLIVKQVKATGTTATDIVGLK